MAPHFIVIRHAQAGAAHFLARHCGCSIVNAGDGAHEHPTQALLDAYTIRQRKRIEGLRVAIVGDILHSRVARSNILLLSKLGADVVACGPPSMLPIGLDRLGCRVTHRVLEALEGAEVVMTLRLQLERIDLRHQRRAHAARRTGGHRHAPRSDEPRRGDHRRGGGWRALGDPRAGHERRGRAHGRALPARGRTRT
jgi:aspartate carbamoyltransferase catalytic subunit